jgi:ABC-type transport system involved in multi-copper enzyme maturation permease subunit
MNTVASPISTSTSASRIRALAGHEFRAAVRSRILVTLLGILTVATVASVYIASVAHRSQVAEYQAYKDAATASGLDRIAPSALAPMSLLRGAFEYLQIIGAVIAVTLGYFTVQRDRVNRTLALVRSRPVTAGEQATGSLIGATAVIATLVGVVGVVGVACIGTIGNDWLNGAELLQLALADLATIVYMTGFYALGVCCAARAHQSINGLVAALCVLVLFVLVTPQIGDTLDADNQIPGGLFKALGLDRADETAILGHFSVYETLRTRIEWISFSQHYQRFVFAMTDVKERYRPFGLGGLMTRVWTDLAWCLAAPTVLIALQRRAIRNQPTIPNKE